MLSQKPLAKIAVAILLSLSLSITASAHPGRTDSKGGHWNRATGEYHYHHGYSEHSHTDMNGDGVLDCPYDFNDVTDYSTANNTGTDNDITLYSNDYSQTTITTTLPSSGSRPIVSESNTIAPLTPVLVAAQSIAGLITFIITRIRPESKHKRLFQCISISCAAILLGYLLSILLDIADFFDLMLLVGNIFSATVLFCVTGLIAACVGIPVIWALYALIRSAVSFIRKKPSKSEQIESLSKNITLLEAENRELRKENDKLQHASNQLNKKCQNLSELPSKLNKRIAESEKIGDALQVQISQLEQALKDENKKQATLKDTVSELLMFIRLYGKTAHCSYLLDKYAGQITRPNGAPDNVYITTNGRPIAGVITSDKPYGDYTVYIVERGTVYHANKECTISSTKPAHLYEICTYRTPCKKCYKDATLPQRPDWYKDTFKFKDN